MTNIPTVALKVRDTKFITKNLQSKLFKLQNGQDYSKIIHAQLLAASVRA